MKYLILILVSALALMGCASPDYAKYAEANQAIETARHNADAAKWQAMADIAAQGDSSAKVGAVMAMAMGGQGSAASGNGLRAPEPNQALQWASILVPSLTQVAGMRYQYLSSTVQSNNARDVAVSTNQTFGNLGASIAAAGANGLTAVSNTAAAGFTALTETSALIQAPAPNITLSGTGTIGGRAYSSIETHAL